MDRQEIIRMAREAGIDAESDTLCRYEGWVEPLQRFAALAAAAEREACAQTARTAMLGSEWVLTERVMKSIRARGEK